MMQQAGVRFLSGDGVTERTDPIRIDFERLLNLDSLMSSAPTSISSDLSFVGWLDETADVFGRLNPFS